VSASLSDIAIAVNK